MRVSTQQFYFQNSRQLSDKQSTLNDQMKYISSGKRVLTAKDDPVSFGTLSGYKDELTNIDKYQRNITQAENRNSLQETSFANAESLMQELKTLFINANNGTLSDSDLKSLAELATNSLNQMLDIANSKDETGGYIFAGYQIDQKPFAIHPGNNVTYLGDNGTRELQIAKNVMVETNQPGDDAFSKVANSIGDFTANYINNTSGVALNRAVIATPSTYDPATNPPDYKFLFTSTTDLTVTDGNGAVVFNTTTYTAGQTVAFNGMEVELSGNPLPGDEFDITPTESISIFDTIKASIDWMNVGASPVDPIQHNVNYGDVLTQLNEALNHMTSRRTEAGVRLKLIETQGNSHAEASLSLASGRSNIEDLDFAKAISTFEQSKVALQAAQQTFVQIKGLSLFNYL
ncbi:flagellar hook-associated protein FlgL [Thalassotalea piscium]|uniref:Flagellar hook-associated protein 3 FlgL n=1 Tax=Thalassotalea piscium TaxID=1230533 RepID=A0A7X0NJQ8_9GAMM|nr:flagellar hook-associated protein FlgL [Thalassotalea piscium]MBB6544722.1 flagellar hook-associated protein 3 FlgL [Thalassotalea piscium]